MMLKHDVCFFRLLSKLPTGVIVLDSFISVSPIYEKPINTESIQSKTVQDTHTYRWARWKALISRCVTAAQVCCRQIRLTKRRRILQHHTRRSHSHSSLSVIHCTCSEKYKQPLPLYTNSLYPSLQPEKCALELRAGWGPLAGHCCLNACPGSFEVLWP